MRGGARGFKLIKERFRVGCVLHYWVRLVLTFVVSLVLFGMPVAVRHSESSGCVTLRWLSSRYNKKAEH